MEFTIYVTLSHFVKLFSWNIYLQWQLFLVLILNSKISQ